MDRVVSQVTETLMRAVVASGCIRRGSDDDTGLAVRVMREELKAFLFEPRYADERFLAMTSASGLAMGSLVTTCVARILTERVA